MGITSAYAAGMWKYYPCHNILRVKNQESRVKVPDTGLKIRFTIEVNRIFDAHGVMRGP